MGAPTLMCGHASEWMCHRCAECADCCKCPLKSIVLEQPLISSHSRKGQELLFLIRKNRKEKES